MYGDAGIAQQQKVGRGDGINSSVYNPIYICIIYHAQFSVEGTSVMGWDVSQSLLLLQNHCPNTRQSK